MKFAFFCNFCSRRGFFGHVGGGASFNSSKFDDGRRYIESEAAAVGSAGARVESSDYGIFVVLQLFSQLARAKPVNRFDK